MEEYILSDDYNLVNKLQDAPIKKDQEEIKVSKVNEISDTEPTDYNLRRPDRETHPVQISEPTMKGQVYMQYSKVKKIDKQTKK